MKAKVRSQRGFAYALTMLGLFIVLCVVLLGVFKAGSSQGGLMMETDSASKIASDSMSGTIAFNLAESGVEYAMEWLHQQPLPPVNTTGFGPSLWNSDSSSTSSVTVVKMTWTGGQGTFGVTMYPNATNTGSTQKRYLIESTGTFNGVKQIVWAYVEQASFGKYAYFTDKDDPGGYWTCGVDAFDGPMHSNNADGNPTNIIWYSASGSQPMFKYTGSDAYTCSASTIGWNENSIGNNTAPSSTSDWSNVAAGGQGTVHTGTAQVALPSSSSLQMNAALGGSTAPSGSAPSVLLPAAAGATTGGLYVHGNVDEMILSTANSGTTQKIEIDQTDSTTTPSTKVQTFITENPSTNTTTYSTTKTQGTSTPVNSTPVSYTGTTNGVVYTDGNIGYSDGQNSFSNYSRGTDSTGGVHGTVADNTLDANGNVTHLAGITIATDSSKNVNLDGSITTNTQRAKDSSGNYLPETQDSNYVTHAGTLGLVSKTIEVIGKDSSGNALTNVEVDGSVMAYDTFDCTNIAGRATGTFQVVGGYIAEKGGYFGMINGSGTLLSGFHEHYNYDARLANDPPPYFPTTGNQYTITSWQRVGSVVP